MTILETITHYKKEEVAFQKKKADKARLMDMPDYERKTLSLVENLPATTGIIAEFKRRSPSKDLINGHSCVEEVTEAYTQYGAAGISVLTDEHFFGGSLNDLHIARRNQIPILRKDFMIDEYQFYEAKANGADVVLLIAACLSPKQVNDYAHLSRELGLEVLLEIHSDEELGHVDEAVHLVGINNRNLKDFKVDIEHSIRLKEKLPHNKPAIAESGIYEVSIFKELRSAGFDGFLMGEYFMKEKDPADAFKRFTDQIAEK